MEDQAEPKNKNDVGGFEACSSVSAYFAIAVFFIPSSANV